MRSYERIPACYTTIRRNKNENKVLSLPIITCYNFRALKSKLYNFCDDMKERSVDCSFLNEIWTVDGDAEFEEEVEEMFHEKGIHFVCNPRSFGKRGGGVALAAKMSKFTLVKCDIPIPSGVECIWGVLKPKFPSNLFNQIICCSFYSPPWAKQNPDLLDHLLCLAI